MNSNRLNDSLLRDLYVLEDEFNPNTSRLDPIWPTSVLDQIFDQLSPEKKTLREILQDIRQEIVTGGRGNIVFPVTSVNGYMDDVVLTKEDLGLGNVDNTADKDKPLSDLQRSLIMDILKDYDFEMNLEELYQHLNDHNNPHAVTIAQLNLNDALEEFILRLIDLHNISKKNTTHNDIRTSLSTLWNYVDDLHNTLEDRLGATLDQASIHYEDPLAHLNLFDAKEDRSNKLASMLDDSKITFESYPSAKAVSDFVMDKLSKFKSTLPNIQDWIANITVVDTRDDVPAPSVKYEHQAYMIRKGVTSHDEIAVCRKNPDGTYGWDYSTLGTYSTLNPNHFVDGVDGLSLNMNTVVAEILNVDAMATELAKTVSIAIPGYLDKYYTKKEFEALGVITDLRMIPGTSYGSVRYYINGDESTMSDDVRVAGLQRLAYLEWITENEIWDQAIHENHIISKAIARRHLQENIIQSKHLSCSYNTLLGNTTDPSGNKANEITLEQLADALVPILRTKLGL